MAESCIPSFERWPLDRCNQNRGWLVVALATSLLLAVSARTVSSQTVQGQLTDPNSGEIVEGALILLVSEAGEDAGGYLTNQAGRFIIQAPGPGTYTLRAERIGYATTQSEAFSLSRNQDLVIPLETTPLAIELEGIRVEGEQQCVVRPREGLLLTNVWEEARKALTVQNWTEQEGLYRFQLTRYERRLDLHGRPVEEGTRQVQVGRSGSPIESLPAEDLLTNGFIRSNPDGGYDYLGPDAAVLLSDEFLDSHCFRLERDPDRPTQLGLAFEPVRPGGIPDIAGTLWLDAETAGLRTLEFGYTWAPWETARGAARGHIEFENLPNGLWVIRNWWIRMPQVRLDMSRPGGTGDDGIRMSGLKEVGGQVTRLSSRTLGDTPLAPQGTLEGLVWDSTSNAPLGSAIVFLSGTQHATQTDEGGAFTLSGLPEGTFSVVFTHPRLTALGTFSEGVDVQMVLGQTTQVALGIPADAGLLLSGCTEDELTDRAGVLTGLVRDANTQDPVEGALVTVTWSDFDVRGKDSFVERHLSLETLSDTTGRYSLCGVPQDATLTLGAEKGGAQTEAAQVNLDPDGYTVVHLEIRRQEF